MANNDPPPPPPNFPLPAVHAALSPYISTPSSTAHSRQLLHTHLTNLAQLPRVSTASGTTTEFTRFLDLELSPTPSLHRQYLTALRAQAAAEADYNNTLSLLPEPEDEEPTTGVDAPWQSEYLSVLRLRRLLTRLQVLREGLSALSSVAPERPLAAAYTGTRPPEPPAEVKAPPRITAGAADVDSVKLALEKRVVQVRGEVARETQALERMREHGTGGGDKQRALEAVHEALVGWLDEALSHESAPEPGVKKKEEGKGGEMQLMLDGIDAAYDRYLASRKRLLALLAPMEAPRMLEVPEGEVQRRIDVSPLPPEPGVLKVVEAAERLAPLKEATKDQMGARNFFAAEIGRRRIGEVEVKGGQEWEETMKRAGANVEKAKLSLGNIRGVVAEVEELVGAKRERRSIPVRRSSTASGGVKKDDSGLWGALGGNVGVIGDGI